MKYIMLVVLALLCFHRRLRSGNPRWLLVAGALTGLALIFRLTPPFAVACAIAVGAVAADRRPRVWFRDWIHFGLGLVAALIPLLVWYAQGPGIDTLWREVVLHPLGMLQALPAPPLHWPAVYERKPIRLAFVALEFRMYRLLYAGYLGVLLWDWARDLREGGGGVGS